MTIQCPYCSNQLSSKRRIVKKIVCKKCNRISIRLPDGRYILNN